MTKIKVCGITRQEDATLASSLGADFLGFIFVSSSPRCITAEHAASIATSAKRVGVFRDASVDEIRRVADLALLDIIQLHGSERDEVVRSIDRPVIRALHVQQQLPQTESSAQWLMFDSGGGTGRAFNWSLLDRYDRSKPFFLAGGLTPDNVIEAIGIARPDGIDVSSGIESAPGVKDHDKMRRLFERIQR